MRLLTTLYVTDHRARITCRDGTLMVIQGDGVWSRVPIESLEAVVLVGNAQVSSEALTACTEHRVRVAALRRNGKVRFTVGGGTSGNVHLRAAQYRAAQDAAASLRIARWIVAGKLQNARRLLQRWSWDARPRERRWLERRESEIAVRIQGVSSATTGDSTRGYEGEGTRIYFDGVRRHLEAAGADFAFETRTRRPPRDPVNCALSFVYGLVLSELVGIIDAVGLDPQIGFLHGLRPGRPSLALDLLEEFRPAVADRFVIGLLARRMLTPADFFQTTGGGCYLTDAGRVRLLEAYEEFKSTEVSHTLLERPVARGSLPVIQATLMARHLRGDLPAYPPFVMAG